MSASGTPREDEQRVASPSRSVSDSSAEDQQQRERHDDAQPPAPPTSSCSNCPPQLDPVAGRESAPRPRRRARPPSTNEPRSRPRTLAVHHDAPLAVLAADLVRPGRRARSAPPRRAARSAARPDAGWSAVTRRGSGNGQPLERRDRRRAAASGRRTTDRSAGRPRTPAPAALAAEGGLDHVLHVGEIEPVARDARRGRSRR